MSTELDLDDCAAQSPIARKQLANLRTEHDAMVVELAVARGLLRDDADKDSAEVAEIARLRAALSRIAEGTVPADQNGHYLAHREAVRLARRALSTTKGA